MILRKVFSWPPAGDYKTGTRSIPLLKNYNVHLTKEAMTNQKHETGAANHIVEHIDAEDYTGTEFSDVGNSLGESDYTSITSSILEHVYENGRRYHSLNAGTYVIPNDEVGDPLEQYFGPD